MEKERGIETELSEILKDCKRERRDKEPTIRKEDFAGFKWRALENAQSTIHSRSTLISVNE